MRRFHALALSTLIIGFSAVVISLMPTESIAKSNSSTQNKPGRLVSLEVKVVEVSELAMLQAGMRINSISPQGKDESFTEKAIALLDAPATRAGVRLVADLAYAIPINQPIRFVSGLDTPTQTTSHTGNGVTMQNFAGYQTNKVSTSFRVQPSGDRILINVDYEAHRSIGAARQGLPPARSNRSGSFAAVIPDGEMRVFGGMMRNDNDSDYLLFFIKPRWID